MSGQVWVVVRYWLSRKTGKRDRATESRVAAFPSRGSAVEYMRQWAAKDIDARCRFEVRRCAGSLASFVDEAPVLLQIRERPEYKTPEYYERRDA